jgi:RND family efflux transporter MFP subunit
MDAKDFARTSAEGRVPGGELRAGKRPANRTALIHTQRHLKSSGPGFGASGVTTRSETIPAQNRGLKPTATLLASRRAADSGVRPNLRRAVGLGLLPAAILAVMLLAGCGRKEPASSTVTELPAIAVRTRTVESKQWPSTEEVLGTVRAKLHATIEAKVSGRIAEMPIVLGQQVTKGQLLARLDAAEIKARLDQAQAGLQQADRDWKRISSLFEQQAVTRSEYDAADFRYLAGKAAAAEAQAMMAYVEVPAPFDGVVTRKWADVGDLAAPAKPLVDLEDPSVLQLEADVPEALASGIRCGTGMAVRVDTLPGEISGVVSEIAPAADSASRTFRIKLDLPATSPKAIAPDSAFRTPRAGQFARLLVPTGENASLRVPASALVRRGQMELVFAVENQRAHLHLVKTGRTDNGETEILSGLDAGDVVVIESAEQLIDGQAVK